MIDTWAGLGYDLDGVRRLNHDAMLERCHVSSCLHNLAFVAEMGPQFCNPASFPSSNGVLQEDTRCVQRIGWHIYTLNFYYICSFLRGGRMRWSGQNMM